MKLAKCAAGPVTDAHAASCRTRKAAVNAGDIVILIVFWGEMILQVGGSIVAGSPKVLLPPMPQFVARGIVGDSLSYFGSPWRILDFFVVVISTLSFVPGNASLGVLRALRAVRALRPLRLIVRFPGLRLVSVLYGLHNPHACGFFYPMSSYGTGHQRHVFCNPACAKHLRGGVLVRVHFCHVSVANFTVGSCGLTHTLHVLLSAQHGRSVL